MTAGRPTDYNENTIKKANEYIQRAVPENMEIVTVEGLAIELDVVPKTLYNWADKYPEFLHTLERIKIIQKQQLIKTGIFGGKEVNATIVKLMLQNNHDMKERTDTTSGDKPLPTPIYGGKSK